jgi:hypothetical protein
MRRKLTTLRAKTGNPLTAPRSIQDIAQYREHHASVAAGSHPKKYDSEYSGWRNPSRPRDQAISLRSFGAPPPD